MDVKSSYMQVLDTSQARSSIVMTCSGVAARLPVDSTSNSAGIGYYRTMGPVLAGITVDKRLFCFRPQPNAPAIHAHSATLQ